MFRKTRIAVLLVTLLVLLGIYLIVKYNQSEDRTFRSKVLSFAPELVTSLEVSDPASGEVEIILDGEGGCLLKSEGKEYPGEADAVQNALAMLNSLTTESIMATSSDKWEEYKVDEDQAIRVKIYEEGDLVGDLFIGKFDFKQLPPRRPGEQPQTKMTSYVRPEEEDQVYAVNGLLRSNFQGGKDPFRDRKLMDAKHTDISKLTMKGPEGELLLDMTTPEWTLNGMPVDSVKTDRQLRRLGRLRSTGFIDNVDLSGSQPAYTLLLEGSTFEPVTIKAYPADSLIGFYITSSLNEGSVFDGSKSNLFEKAFAGQEKFLPEE